MSRISGGKSRVGAGTLLAQLGSAITGSGNTRGQIACSTMTSTPAIRLPRARDVQPELASRGFIRVPDLLECADLGALFAVAMQLVGHHGTTVIREELAYRVVTGERIRADGAPLFSLYESRDLLMWLREVTQSATVGLSSHVRSAININCLHRAGQQYPWHRDVVPYTCIVFLTSLPATAGGELMIRTANGALVTVEARAGDLVVMDGARCPHAVAPLTENRLRLSIPMVYPTVSVDRPPGLDEQLYEARTSRPATNGSN